MIQFGSPRDTVRCAGVIPRDLSEIIAAIQ
jgi:hypothetical protein